MDSVTEPSIEFVWKLNSGRWNPLATTAVVPFVMLIRTILIPNLDCLDGERNPLHQLMSLGPVLCSKNAELTGEFPDYLGLVWRQLGILPYFQFNVDALSSDEVVPQSQHHSYHNIYQLVECNE